uniref:Transposase MuDR plant domain-containing protein n=1 Tax=Nicotiana tabacum TaxID=4097 RepID=A0A1S3XEH4_TOBAC|nr:PREDICTED: uncharacterized protein LOC107764190 [Nicotiana tabacum]XP_016438225.1 PREDICTED: uncharacterized protein LOC107764190 [Nicotiana tabacum]XP_016438233.1 PREDICTED: uncharacterized protein LOC107764190 [Nicotiana tabacum]XP_016438243.1 PREDICTED: uncharacterized protein LOC107764190 [Nicotiana tabacum]XP_016438250.1 PREDICTED: uncharacterized protein LOC107764190 [Nicotiana tabacum]XP_016438257.1 PREDICTED: uncharacterized protein LOC107764190 [Nicotiana tabacum]XP_016438265.1 PR
MLVSEVGPLYVGGRVQHVTNVDCDHLSIPELVDYAKEFGITKLGKTFIMSAKCGNLVELTKDRDLMDLAMLLNNGDTIDIFVSCDSQFEEVDASSQISHVGDPFNASSSTQQDNRESDVPCGPSLNATAANPDLGLSTPLKTIVQEDSPLDWTSSSEEEESATAASHGLSNISQQVELAAAAAAPQQEDSPIYWTSSSEEEESVAATDSQQVESAGEEEEIASGHESERSFDYGSDVHEELRVVKEDLKKYRQRNRRKIRLKKPDGFLGEVGVDEGFENIDQPKKNMRDKLGGDDEPYYDSSDPDSFESESDVEGEGHPVSDDDVDDMGSLRGRKKTNRVVYDPSAKIVIWQLGMVFENVQEFREAVTKYAIKKGIQLVKDPNEPHRVRVKCKKGCPWLLYASREGRSTNFTIKTYNPRHKCHRTTYNYMCNSKYVAKKFKDRITS